MKSNKDITGEEKKPFTFRFHIKLIEKLRQLGEKENRDLTNFIENIFINFVKKKK